MKIIQCNTSADGSRKYVFEVPGKGETEAIYFTFSGKYREKLIKDKVICLSSQVGCNLKCSFCSTGKMNVCHSLSTSEMTSEVDLIRQDLLKHKLPQPQYYALMGMGEPLLNLKNVILFFQKHKHKVKGISLSTAGIVNNIVKLANDDSTDFTLYISLHTPYNSQRSKLMPINERWSIEKVLDAGKLYAKAKGRKTVLTYMLIPGVNDTDKHLDDLAKLIDPQYFMVQLTCYNPENVDNIESVKQHFVKTIPIFKKYMDEANIEYDVQISKGADVKGGCGQLANN